MTQAIIAFHFVLIYFFKFSFSFYFWISITQNFIESNLVLPRIVLFFLNQKFIFIFFETFNYPQFF